MRTALLLSPSWAPLLPLPAAPGADLRVALNWGLARTRKVNFACSLVATEGKKKEPGIEARDRRPKMRDFDPSPRRRNGRQDGNAMEGRANSRARFRRETLASRSAKASSVCSGSRKQPKLTVVRINETRRFLHSADVRRAQRSIVVDLRRARTRIFDEYAMIHRELALITKLSRDTLRSRTQLASSTSFPGRYSSANYAGHSLHPPHYSSSAPRPSPAGRPPSSSFATFLSSSSSSSSAPRNLSG